MQGGGFILRMAKSSVYILVLGTVLTMLLGNGNCQEGNCGANQEWKNCSTCPPRTCDDVASMRTRTMCAQVCTKRCVCTGNFVFNAKNQCVSPSECPCKKNAYYTKEGCVDNCPVTCDNYENPPTEPCIEICRKGCNCNKGYIRVVDTGECVLQNDCPKKTAP